MFDFLINDKKEKKKTVFLRCQLKKRKRMFFFETETDTITLIFAGFA